VVFEIECPKHPLVMALEPVTCHTAVYLQRCIGWCVLSVTV